MSRIDVAVAFANRLAGLHEHRQRSGIRFGDEGMFRRLALTRILVDRMFPRGWNARA